MTPPSAFTDPAAQPHLYGNAARLARRTTALHAAKVAGGDASTTLAQLAAHYQPHAGLTADIGCGRGSAALQLARHLPATRPLLVDQSDALLRAACQRLTDADIRPIMLRADFHRLPLADAVLDVALAAFCLYHSPDPGRVVAEIGRTLTPRGVALFATKSASSYHELDKLVAHSGLDPDADAGPSLYAAFHTGNAEPIVNAHLRIHRIEHQRHTFVFTNLAHVAAYLATTPKYRIPPDLTGNPELLADALRMRLADQPVTATSTVTYVVAGHR